MRVIFMGTPDFSVGTLEALVKAGHEVAAVVTQPDKPKGRGKAVQFPPVKEKALSFQIPVYQPVKVREPEFVEVLRSLKPDVIVVVAFGQILPKEILEMPVFGCVNVHASLLPKYRGAAPIQWAVIEGEKVSGVTTMKMDEGLDTGDMILKAEVPLEEKETGESLHDKLAEAGAKLLIETLKGLEEKTVTFTKQKDEESCYAKMLNKKMGKICWKDDAVKIERLIRGLNSWPSAYTSLHGKIIKIWSADVVETETGKKPGTVVSLSKTELIIQTGNNCLSLKEIQMEGKKRMQAADFLRGFLIEQGWILGE